MAVLLKALDFSTDAFSHPFHKGSFVFSYKSVLKRMLSSNHLQVMISLADYNVHVPTHLHVMFLLYVNLVYYRFRYNYFCRIVCEE